jgi:hypothetical protein
MLHQEVFWSVGADHRLGNGDQLHFLALENRSSGRGFQGVTE